MKLDGKDHSTGYVSVGRVSLQVSTYSDIVATGSTYLVFIGKNELRIA